MVLDLNAAVPAANSASSVRFFAASSSYESTKRRYTDAVAMRVERVSVRTGSRLKASRSVLRRKVEVEACEQIFELALGQHDGPRSTVVRER